MGSANIFFDKNESETILSSKKEKGEKDAKESKIW